jgi:hypothetical protein
MVRPAAFARNEVTRPSNKFQAASLARQPDEIAADALLEFDNCVAALERNGIGVRVFPGRTTSVLPDEVFPNNWITTHPNGAVVLYPMLAWNRRLERRRDVLEGLQKGSDGFRIARLIDLTSLEKSNYFLEGTGSLVFDHGNSIAYACLSPRTHLKALREFGRQTGYNIVPFKAFDAGGHAIYHTNVMMSLGEDFAVVCLESIPAVYERLRVVTRLERSGREVIEIGRAQLGSFVGNLLQLRTGDQRIIVLSTRAHAALTPRQKEALGRHGKLVALDIGTIESAGGGSVRCMLAEIHLPPKAPRAGV